MCIKNSYLLNIFLQNTIISILLFWEFLIPALVDGFLLEFEWQQVSPSLQDS